VHRVTHVGCSGQQPVLMQTSVRRQSSPELHLRPLQHGCTQLLRPETVLMQKHSFLVFLHSLRHPEPRRGHLGAAAASLAATPSPAAPSTLAAANRSALRREMVRLAGALVRLSKSSLALLVPLSPLKRAGTPRQAPNHP
jgi:hypothetical protein